MNDFRCGVLAAVLLASTFGVAVAQQAPAAGAPAAPAAGAPAASAPAAGAQTPIPEMPAPEPPASTLAAARDVVIASGMARSFAPMVPELRSQIVPLLTRTRPEMAKDLGETLKQLTPEFDKKTDDMIDIAAHIYARHMTEDELKQTAAFFNSPVGKKYVEAQPTMLDEIVVAMQSWTQQISTYMMTRLRQEMEKKGHPF
jgi:hypothetical protein